MEIITLAVFLLGGDSHYVDTEDVAVKANELAPGKFTWIKYKDQINIDAVRKRLWDAKTDTNPNYILGSEKQGWMLTSSGLELARSKLDTLKNLKATRQKRSEPEKRWMRTERIRMVKSEAYAKIIRDKVDSVTLEEAEAFFRLNAYIVGKARDRIILRVMNLFGDDPELGPVVRAVAEKVRSR